jgi:hypothetical protein
MSPPTLLSPRRVTLRTSFGDQPLVKQEADEDKSDAAAADDAAVTDERPNKALRMQMRQKKKATMDGGSSAHNAAPLQRTHSVYFPCPVQATEEKDTEMLFAQSELCALRSPRKSSSGRRTRWRASTWTSTLSSSSSTCLTLIRST